MKNYYFKLEGEAHEKVKSILFYVLLFFFIAFVYAYVFAVRDKQEAVLNYFHAAMKFSLGLTIATSIIKYFEMKYIDRKEKDKNETDLNS